MTDKVQKIRKEVEQLMYGFNLEADIASCEDVETEKFANIKYQLCKKILEYINTMQEEPVSEDLEEAAKHYLYSNILYDDVYVGNPTDKDCIEMFKAGAQWQEKQDQSTIELAEDHAMLAGMNKMEEQMMAKAIDGTVQKDNQVILDDGTYMDLDPSMQLKPSFVGLKEGDRIKVILIKED